MLLSSVKAMKKFALAVVMGNRGFYGDLNNCIIKKDEVRIAEFNDLGLSYAVIQGRGL